VGWSVFEISEEGDSTRRTESWGIPTHYRVAVFKYEPENNKRALKRLLPLLERGGSDDDE
jgi:hypothetical protein